VLGDPAIQFEEVVHGEWHWGRTRGTNDFTALRMLLAPHPSLLCAALGHRRVPPFSGPFARNADFL